MRTLAQSKDPYSHTLVAATKILRLPSYSAQDDNAKNVYLETSENPCRNNSLLPIPPRN
jgi:hypothetical protein